MATTTPLPILDDHQEKHKNEQTDEDEEEELASHEVVPRFTCFTLLHKGEIIRRGEKLYGQWKQEQKLRASRMEYHLSEDWALDKLIEEQLSRLPLEMTTLAWFGNWRPSAILSLLHSLSKSKSGFLRLDGRVGRILTQLIKETRIEEAVLDEEMAEIQATCIYHLPFSPTNSGGDSGNSLASLISEFKKIHHVITRAQILRYRTLESVVKKLLNRTQAAEFLVAFAGIQDMVHEYAANQMRQKGPITVTIKPLDT